MLVLPRIYDQRHGALSYRPPRRPRNFRSRSGMGVLAMWRAVLRGTGSRCDSGSHRFRGQKIRAVCCLCLDSGEHMHAEHLRLGRKVLMRFVLWCRWIASGVANPDRMRLSGFRDGQEVTGSSILPRGDRVLGAAGPTARL